MCGEWASHGFCEDDAHTGYMLVFCKKSCEVCDSGIGGSEQTTDAPLSITQSPGNLLKCLHFTVLKIKSLSNSEANNLMNIFTQYKMLLNECI